MPRRRPYPRLARGASRLPVAVTALVGAGVVAAWVRAPAPSVSGDRAPGGFVDLAVRRLRAAVVGDVRVDAGPHGAPAVGPRLSEHQRARQALARRVRERLGARSPIGPDDVTPGVPWWADSAHWGPEVIRRRDVVRPVVEVEAGDTLLLPAPDLPALLPDALRRRGVYWAADGGVQILPPGDEPAGSRRVVAAEPGEAVVTATTAVGRTAIPVRVHSAVRGRLYPVDATGNASEVRARVLVTRPGAAPDTAWTDAAGRFRLALPDDWTGAADVRVEPLDADGRPATGYRTTELPAVPAERLHRLGVVLVPLRWTVAAGVHAGESVPVRPELARGFWPFARSAAGTRRPVGWADDAARTVAFEPGGPAVDTAAFWAAARALGRAWGRALFVPAASGDEADVTVRVTPGIGASGLTTLGWTQESGGVGGGRVEFRSAAVAADPRVVQHELLHVLAFGHARGWGSVLAPAGWGGAAGPTAADVAYGHAFEALRRQARRAEREYGAAFGPPDQVP